MPDVVVQFVLEVTLTSSQHFKTLCPSKNKILFLLMLLQTTGVRTAAPTMKTRLGRDELSGPQTKLSLVGHGAVV